MYIYFARKQRNGGLTDDERYYEQKKLRELYLEGIRVQLVDALDSIGLKPKRQPGKQPEKHYGDCPCGHCHGS